MLWRRNANKTETDEKKEEAIAQDGFIARVTPGARRPWAMRRAALQIEPLEDESAPLEEPQEEASPRPAVYDVAGVRGMELADNGDGTVTVLRCSDPEIDDLDIQFEAGGCPVTAIAPRAFEGCAALRRVILPAELRMIGEMAFSGCTGIEEVAIPAGVVRVGTLAFAKCQNLRRVRIEPGVQALGPSCFSKCARLERVDIPSSVTGFGGGVFFGCSKTLTLYGAADTMAERYAKMNGVAFDSMSFKDDPDLVLEENADGTLTLVAPRRSNAIFLEIPSELCGRRISRIGEKAFFGHETLEQIVIGSGVQEIGESAFFGCRALISVTFERGLERVGENAFADCVSLSRVTLPWGTKSVGRMAFFGCGSLSFVKMPPATLVSPLAFDGCAPGLRVYGGVSAGHRETQQ